MTSIFKPNNQATVGRNAFFAASAALFSDGKSLRASPSLSPSSSSFFSLYSFDLETNAFLFATGYQNGVVGLANLVLRKLHPVEMAGMLADFSRPHINRASLERVLIDLPSFSISSSRKARCILQLLRFPWYHFR